MYSDINRFIGRKDALDAFQSLLSVRAQRNILYIEADGGLGKTRLMHRIIEECENKPHWSVRPLGSALTPPEIIIDFFELRHRSLEGLRHSIIERLGVNFFADFEQSETRLRAAERKFKIGQVDETISETDQNASVSAVIALRRRTDDLFFHNLRAALRRRQVVLFFDTFEVAYRQRVGRWFLEQFLRRAGCLIVFAGRPLSRTMEPNILHFPLKPWTAAEAAKYYQSRTGIKRLSNVDKELLTKLRGRPLLVELALYFSDERIASREELANVPEAEIELALVNFFTSPHPSEFQVVQDMAYLKRRFDPQIFDVRKPYGDIADFATLQRQLLETDINAIVKYRPLDRVFTLHDEFQRLFAQHAWRRKDSDAPRPQWDRRCADMYQKVVTEWYSQAIDQARTEETQAHTEEARSRAEIKQALLMAEQLGYVLEHDLKEGFALYTQRFQEAKAGQRFILNDLLWGEIVEHLAKDSEQARAIYAVDPAMLEEARALYWDQADWLFTANRFVEAAELYDAFEQRFPAAPQSMCDQALVRLGHVHYRLSNLGQAEKAWTQGLEQAKHDGRKASQATFEWNLGHAYFAQSRWLDALKIYEDAIEHSREERRHIQMAEIYLASARLRARLGEYEQAATECDRALDILKQEGANLLPERLAQAYVYAADVYRYKGETDTALGYYERAEHLFAPLKERYDWHSQALSSLGANLHLIGVKQREKFGDLEADTERQSAAFNYHLQSLNLIRQHELASLFAKTFDRLADLCLELEILERSSDKEPPVADKVRLLREQLFALDLPEEAQWTFELLDGNTPFQELDVLGRAQRLLELAFHQAESVQQYNDALNSLTSAAAVARRRRRIDHVRRYADHVERLRGTTFPQQEKIFQALMDIVEADLALDRQDYQNALPLYIGAFAELANVGGFGLFRMRSRLPEFGNRILSLPSDIAADWCQQIETQWSKSIPNHLEMIKYIRGLYNQITSTQGDEILR